jgi:hypothetical protein
VAALSQLPADLAALFVKLSTPTARSPDQNSEGNALHFFLDCGYLWEEDFPQISFRIGAHGDVPRIYRVGWQHVALKLI